MSEENIRKLICPCEGEECPKIKAVEAHIRAESRRARMDAREHDKQLVLSELKEEMAWIAGNDTGMSSIAIWCAMMGVAPSRDSTPSDPSDFGRCYRLLKKFPYWKEKLYKLPKVLSYKRGKTEENLWQVFADNYSKMAALYEEEQPSGRLPKLYALMQDLGF